MCFNGRFDDSERIPNTTNISLVGPKLQGMNVRHAISSEHIYSKFNRVCLMVFPFNSLTLAIASRRTYFQKYVIEIIWSRAHCSHVIYVDLDLQRKLHY